MLSIATFWLLLSLPGYALLRSLRPTLLEGGLLSGIALGYLGTFAVLSPISIGAYLLELPLATLSVAIVLCVVGSLLWLVRDLYGKWLWPKPSLIGILAFAAIANDVIGGLATGSPLMGDAGYHIGRVRMLLAFGFNSWDPLVAGHRFDATYHSNLYHALMAAACQLTHSEPAATWVYSLSWAKLFAAACIYHLAWVVLGKRWIGWIAAAMFAVSASSGWLLVIPNNLTMYSLLLLGMAFAIQVLRGEEDWAAVAGLAATGVAMAEFHRLCFVFLAVSVAPVLLGRFVYLALHGRPHRRTLGAALLGLGLGAAFLAPELAERARPLVRATSAHFDRQPTDAPNARQELGAEEPVSNAPAPRERHLMYKNFVRLGGERVVFDPAFLQDPRDTALQLLVSLVLGMFCRRRVQLAILAGFVSIVLAVLYVPPLCTAAFHAAGNGWMVARLFGVVGCVHAAVVPGVLLLLIAERLDALAGHAAPWLWRVSATVLPVVGLGGAFGLAFINDGGHARWPWADHFTASHSAETAERLDYFAKQRAFVMSFVPVGSILAAPRFTELIMTSDCYPLAVPPERGDYGIPDMQQRRAGLETLIGRSASLSDRVAVLRRYQVRYIYLPHFGQPAEHALARIYAPITVGRSEVRGSVILHLDPERPFESPPSDRRRAHRRPSDSPEAHQGGGSSG